MPSLPLLCCSYRMRARLPVHPGSECCCMTYHAAVMRTGVGKGGLRDTCDSGYTEISAVERSELCFFWRMHTSLTTRGKGSGVVLRR